MKRIDVVHKGNEWVAQDSRKRRLTGADTKVEAVRKTAQLARSDRDSVTVKIHNQNGRIQEERTYPRSADPRSRKG